MPPARTPFAHSVLRVVASLAAGEVLTYGEVAREAGRPGAARAVGAVLRRHGSEVPWWRVVAADGRLAGPVAAEQERRLAREGVRAQAGRVRPGPPPAGA
jgi:methylated-DNA-protein-cysteine methyltransferase related protein